MTRTGFDTNAVADAVTQPPFSAVTARGDRLRRRRVRIGVLAVAAVALAGTAVAPSAARWHSGPPASPPDRTAGSGSVFTDTILADDRTIVMVKRNACAAAFSVSTDAGESWSAYRGPVEWRECGIPVSTGYEILGPTVYAATVDGDRYISRDSAATWQPAGDSFTVLDALPDRTVPRGKGALQGVDPVTGAAYQVRRTATVAMVADARFAADGALWVVGRGTVEEFSSGTPTQVVVSPDRGRTWAPAGTLPSIGVDPLVVPVSARQAYVLGAGNGQGTVHRTDDGGRTWTPTVADWAVLTTATVSNAGRLMVYGGRPNGERFVWTSDDDGRTFTAVPVTEPGFTTAGHLADSIWRATPQGTVAVTHDGRTWRRTTARS